jgi:hypothetical protein
MTALRLLAQADAVTRFEWGRLQSFTEGWHYLLLLLVCAALVGFAVWMIRRDSIELPKWLTVVLAALRLAALAGLLVFFLQLEKRTERKLVHNSRALVLVDTSLSMSLRDTQPSTSSANRIEQTRCNRVAL